MRLLANENILLRVPIPKGQEGGQQLANMITARSDWAGHFSVVEPGRIRMTILPPVKH